MATGADASPTRSFCAEGSCGTGRRESAWLRGRPDGAKGRKRRDGIRVRTRGAMLANPTLRHLFSGGAVPWPRTRKALGSGPQLFEVLSPVPAGERTGGMVMQCLQNEQGHLLRWRKTRWRFYVERLGEMKAQGQSSLGFRNGSTSTNPQLCYELLRFHRPGGADLSRGTIAWKRPHNGSAADSTPC